MSEAKIKKPVFKRVWFWLLMVFIGFPLFLVFIGLLLPKSEKPTSVADETTEHSLSSSTAEAPAKTATPEPPPETEPVIAKTLGVSRKAARKGFETFPEVKGTDIDGQDNYVYSKGNLMLQIIGDEDDILQASLTITSDGSKKASDMGAYGLNLLVHNVYSGSDANSVLSDIGDKIKARGGTLYAGDKTIEVTTTDIDKIAVMTVTIKP